MLLFHVEVCNDPVARSRTVARANRKECDGRRPPLQGEIAIARVIIRVTLSIVTISPNKLFDYLDGKLAPQEREELEARMANDSPILSVSWPSRENCAKRCPGREVLARWTRERNRRSAGAIISRRWVWRFIVLVFVNVHRTLVRLSKRETVGKARDADMRHRSSDRGKAAASAMPTPTSRPMKSKSVRPRLRRKGRQ